MPSSVVVGCFGCLTDLATFDLDERQRLFVEGEEKKGPFDWTCSRCGAEYRKKAPEIKQALVPEIFEAADDRYHLLLVRQPILPKRSARS
jgi:hypothetical protein